MDIMNNLYFGWKQLKSCREFELRSLCVEVQKRLSANEFANNVCLELLLMIKDDKFGTPGGGYTHIWAI